MERTDTTTVENAMEPEDWAYFTSGGVQKHVISDAIDITLHERGRDLTPHGLGALCLYGTREGFTSDDVTRLGELAAKLDADQFYPTVAETDFLRSLAARIAALLPPDHAASS